ncbi:arylsulfatase B-like isoform X2 [Anoplophora glabripennis]|nr:arylsulfatase B-like isoform X2 [Anoplophora glabripennis]
MQHLVILESEPWGLSLNETLIPQYLKRNGYATHALGKWHLGFFKKEYTPTFRGFDSHYGYWQGLQDYFDHTVHATYTSEVGYDMRKNMSVDYSAKGKYSTTLFTEEAVRLIQQHDTNRPMFMYLSHLAPHSGNDNNPLQAPDEEIAKFSNIEDPERRIYAAMVSLLDQSVGNVITALREKHMLENSIVLFMSDNGAQPEGIHANHGSNYPFKGAKNSAWEGAMRNLAVIWSPLIKYPQRVSNHFMHVTDWLPTFFSAAGLNKTELPTIDGLDMWNCISEGTMSPRTELIYNIDDIVNYGALRIGDLKYIYGSTNGGKADKWFGNSGKSDLYIYDSQAVLSSKAASAFAGVITHSQIKEKNKIVPVLGNDTFNLTLINKKAILRLRQEATINCPEVSQKSQYSKCDVMTAPCLFNITHDPCERINLAKEKLMEMMYFKEAIERYRKTAISPRNVPQDPNADPIKWNNTWTNWKDYENVRKKIVINQLSPLALGLLISAIIVVLFIVVMLINLNLKQFWTRGENRNNCLFRSSDEDPIVNIVDNKTRLFEDKELQARVYLKEELRTLE